MKDIGTWYRINIPSVYVRVLYSHPTKSNCPLASDIKVTKVMVSTILLQRLTYTLIQLIVLLS